MFDIHSHLLPAIDDGSESVFSSEKSIESLKKAGIGGLAFTPHFYPSKTKLSHFLQKRDEALSKIGESEVLNDLKITYGAEVYLSYTLFNFEDLSPLCYKGTDTILVEPKSEEKFSAETEKKLTKLINDYPVTPIIAHIDRFPAIIGDLKVLSFLREMGYLFQINSEGLSNFFVKKKIYKAIEYGFCDFIGNDLHKDALNVSEFNRSINTLEKKFGKEFLDYLDKNSERFIFV